MTLHLQEVRQPLCTVCNSEGDLVYTDVQDNVYLTSGTWSIRKCGREECGLLWLDPAPRADEVMKAYQDYHTHVSSTDGRITEDSASRIRQVLKPLDQLLRDAYLSAKYGYPSRLPNWPSFFTWFLPVRRKYYSSSIAYLPYLVGGVLLDVGSGNGSFLWRMHKLGWEVQGVEPDAAGAAAALRHYGLEVYQGELHSRQYPDHSFDAVTLRSVIEHVHAPGVLLRECYRILRPGGLLVVITPNSQSLGARFFKQAWRGLEPPRHIHIFSPRALTQIVSEAGFELIDLQTTAHDRYILSASYAIAKGRRFSRGTPQLHVSERLFFAMLSLAQALLLLVNWQWGEEIVLIAEK